MQLSCRSLPVPALNLTSWQISLLSYRPSFSTYLLLFFPKSLLTLVFIRTTLSPPFSSSLLSIVHWPRAYIVDAGYLNSSTFTIFTICRFIRCVQFYPFTYEEKTPYRIPSVFEWACTSDYVQ